MARKIPPMSASFRHLDQVGQRTAVRSTLSSVAIAHVNVSSLPYLRRVLWPPSPSMDFFLLPLILSSHYSFCTKAQPVFPPRTNHYTNTNGYYQPRTRPGHPCNNRMWYPGDCGGYPPLRRTVEKQCLVRGRRLVDGCKLDPFIQHASSGLHQYAC